MQASKLSSGQLKVAVTGFLSLFSIVGIMVYGLPFFYDFWVKDYGWSRATVTSGNAFFPRRVNSEKQGVRHRN